jgi:multiple sugar transport system ATP-binding protein
VLGVRPQNIEDAALVDSKDTDSTIDATVELREDLGAEVDVHVGIDAPVPALEAVIEATESADAAGPAGRPEGIFVARLGPGTGAREGHRVKLWLDPRALHFFDPDSGEALYD